MNTRAAGLLCALQMAAAIGCVPSTPATPSSVPGPAGLWLGAQPPGTNGQATLGDNWQDQKVRSLTGDLFSSPTLEEVRVFDLIDRGFEPQAASDWMNSSGYATSAAYYPSIHVIGFPTEYMALINGRWDLVVRIGG